VEVDDPCSREGVKATTAARREERCRQGGFLLACGHPGLTDAYVDADVVPVRHDAVSPVAFRGQAPG
jgi:hypothetical protein